MNSPGSQSEPPLLRVPLMRRPGPFRRRKTTWDVVVKQSNVAALADDVTIHRLQNVSARRPGRYIELRIERVEFENVVMSGPTLRGARRLVTIDAANVLALHSAVYRRQVGLTPSGSDVAVAGMLKTVQCVTSIMPFCGFASVSCMISVSVTAAFGTFVHDRG